MNDPPCPTRRRLINTTATADRKIVRENLTIFLSALIQKVIGIRVLSSEDLTDSLQYTIERKPDVLKRVWDDQHDVFVLHLEFQSADDDRMLKRMLLYRALLYENTNYPSGNTSYIWVRSIRSCLLNYGKNVCNSVICCSI